MPLSLTCSRGCLRSSVGSERLPPVSEDDRSESYVFIERGSDRDDIEDADGDGPDRCGVCAGPGPLRVCRLDPSAQPGGAWAIASIWHLCADCLAVIAAADPQALKSRLRLEDQAAPYADVLVAGLLKGFHLDR